MCTQINQPFHLNHLPWQEQLAAGHKTGIWRRLEPSSELAHHTEDHKQVGGYDHGKNLETDELAVLQYLLV